MNPDLAFAIQLADLADSISLPRFRAVDLVVETKPDMTPVSEADRAVELAIRERVAMDRPGDVVLGEEFGAGEGNSSRRSGATADGGTALSTNGLLHEEVLAILRPDLS